jgi:hypothetical protein
MEYAGILTRRRRRPPSMPKHRKKRRPPKRSLALPDLEQTIESGDHLYTDATRNAVFSRITEIQEEVMVLKKIVVEDFESWAGAHGVNLSAAENQTGVALRKLKGD